MKRTEHSAFRPDLLLRTGRTKYFNSFELLWKAKEPQESVNNEVSKSVGIYRMVSKKKLPFYYIGEYIDNAGLLKSYK